MQRFVTILLLAASMRCADADPVKLRGGVSLVHPAYATEQRRELGAFDWWANLLNAMHGPLSHHSGGDSSGSTSEGDGSDSDSGGDGGGEGDGDGGDEVDGDEEGWESNYLEASGSYSGTGSATGGTLGQTSLWVLVAAAMVAAATGVAFVKRKSQDDDDVLSARAESLAGNLHSSNTVVTTRTTRTTEGMEMGLNDFAVPQSEDASVESALDYASLDAAIDDAATFLSAISKNAEENEHAMPGNRNEEVNANHQPSEGRLSKMKKRMHLWKKRRVDALI